MNIDIKTTWNKVWENFSQKNTIFLSNSSGNDLLSLQNILVTDHVMNNYFKTHKYLS